VVLALLGSRLQSPADGVRWVLFSGNDVKVQGTAEDEAEARKARASFSGDLLWFRLNRKTYVTQDPQTMERLRMSSNAADASTQARELREAERALLSNQQRAFTNLQLNLAQIEGTLNRALNDTNRVELEKTYADLLRQFAVNRAESERAKAVMEQQLVELEKVLMQLSNDARANKDNPGANIELQRQFNATLSQNMAAKAMMERQLAELEKILRQLRNDSRLNKDNQAPGADILRDAIESGKAKEAP
jgi:hypothetical protein